VCDMEIVREIERWKGKPKELVSDLSHKVVDDEKLFVRLVDCLKTGSEVDKGICMEVMKYVTRERPQYALPYVDTIVAHINDEAPKVKWGTAEVIGNVAQGFPDRVSLAVPRLLRNTGDSGTVTRWCAAFALTEIAKHSEKQREALTAKFGEILAKEKNNGVKNVYLRALKKMKEA
jgi:hypothetical protein